MSATDLTSPTAPDSTAGAGGHQDFARVFNQLCHMVALSRTGKTTTVVEALVSRATVLARDDVALDSVDDVRAVIAKIFGVRVDLDDVTRTVEALIRDGRLIRRNNRLCLVGGYLDETQAAIERSEASDQTVREGWIAEVTSSDLPLDPVDDDQLWEVMRGFMIRVFREHGTHSAQLLDPSISGTVSESEKLNSHAAAAMLEAGVAVDHCDALHQAIDKFFDSTSAARTDWISQHLDATFTFFALSTPDAAANYLRDQFRHLDLFLDTNFLLDLLGPVGDPEHDSAVELLRFIDDNSLPITLRYHVRTRDEIRNVLRGIGGHLKSRRWSQAMSRAIVKTGQAHGLELLYHHRNAEQAVSTRVFMRKYEQYLDEVLKDLGISLFRPKSEEYEGQEKHLLVEEIKTYAAKNRPDIDKEYETFEHDIAVWLTIRERRLPVASAIHSGALFLSRDRFFHEFDRDELRAGGAPTVVLPHMLLQVLRPFGRNDADYDEMFTKAFRVASFRTAHRDYADTTAELTSWLSTCQGVSEQTAIEILSNEMLQQQLSQVEDDDEFSAIVETEVLRINGELEKERNRALEEGEELTAELATATADRDQERAARRAAETRAAALKGEASQLRKQVDEVTGRLQTLETEAEARARRQQELQDRRDHRLRHVYSGLAGVVVAAAVVATFVLTGWPDDEHSHQAGIYFLGVIVPLLGGWGVAAPDKWKVVSGVTTLALMVAPVL